MACDDFRGEAVVRKYWTVYLEKSREIHLRGHPDSGRMRNRKGVYGVVLDMPSFAVASLSWHRDCDLDLLAGMCSLADILHADHASRNAGPADRKL
jgi:hypothetical protein